MNPHDFMKQSPTKRVDLVNNLLKKEKSDHLKRVAELIGINPSTFSKIMIEGDYQYHQAKRQYYKLLTIDEYKQIKFKTNESQDELLSFLNENMDELKALLELTKKQLILEPEIYDSSSKTITKSIQVNTDIYEKFASLHTTKFPHLRLRELFSKCLLDFINNYQD